VSLAFIIIQHVLSLVYIQLSEHTTCVRHYTLNTTIFFVIWLTVHSYSVPEITRDLLVHAREGKIFFHSYTFLYINYSLW
jgi:hypothetical protein